MGLLETANDSLTTFIISLQSSKAPRVADANIILEPEARLVPGQIGALCIPYGKKLRSWGRFAN
ncbi:hypothetical protein F9C07_9389 [Aspergillus flavus]|uniref:Uncharacterized protein n=1 Tax=Aspergillus flavus (strain ATCC 200026 / FGSC A1120 / IAM 13836 / NRRL 3357 / JCM 12722 / SRRC 167) TaxID=332952 RepID=A0A7U2MCH5_ASPFN|nr:hypothetical protein F9C07_9389 [Aspergillus flavus]